MNIKISKFSQVILSIAFVTLISNNAYSADISALNFNGDLIGKVMPEGTVINFDNEVIGRITADSFVFDEADELIGGITPKGVAVSYNNTILGKVNNDGTVTGINDNLIGKVLPNGLVVNDNFDVLGAVISPGLVYNDKGAIVGRVSGNGSFYNLSGEKSGFVTASGYAYTTTGGDKKTVLAGRLISSKIVNSPTGKFLGSIAPDGKVIDHKKNVIGNIHANGFVYDIDGKVVGHVVEEGYAFNIDGSYLGVVSYNGEVINKGHAVALSTYGNRVINPKGDTVGFTVSMSATANAPDGSPIGRIITNGNIAKGRNIIGKIGASGRVIDNSGKVIGTINYTGPIFNYLGKIRANASVGGKVISLEGAELGYMQKNDAFDRKGRRIGRILKNQLSFDENNNFIGVSGVDSLITYNGKIYTISPYGYVFDENGKISGQSFSSANIFTPEGNVLAYISGNGKTENESLNKIAKITGSGYMIDKNNKILGKNIDSIYVTNFLGESLGYLNQTNLIIDSKNKAFAKVLPDGDVVNLVGKANKNFGRAGNASISISINGDYLGTNTPDGLVQNSNTNIGKISSSGYVLDNMGALYGTTLPYGVVVASDCRFLGVISDNGDARTTKDAYIGMVLANNQVVNDVEEVIGHVVYPQKINDNKGKVWGVTSPTGMVLNYENQKLGCVDSSGLVRNSQKEIIGQIISNTTIMGFDNKIAGYTSFDGSVVDNNGVYLADISTDGNIRSKQGKNIGVMFRYSVAFDSNNVYLGRVNSEGKVISDKGEVLGHVNYNGQVITKNKNSGFALYDLYAYDDKGKTIGYIAKNGRVYSIMGEVKGSIYNGFVLDKKQNLVGRGARDYNILNSDKESIGYLNLDGSVTDNKNIEIGRLEENGDIVNASGTVIAKADPLQYYHKKIEVEPKDEEVIKPKEQTQNIETKEEIENETEEDAEIEEETIEEAPQSEDVRINSRVIGIAVDPNGNYLGDILENRDVVNSNGETIGHATQEGDIINEQGERIGVVQDNKPKGKTPWWLQSGTTINPYAQGSEITNVGPAGGTGPGGRYNPRRAAILSQLHDERRRTMSVSKISPGYDASSYTGWQSDWGIRKVVSSLRVNMDNMITQDKPIPAVLARSVISLGVGEAPVTAIVERNIYGDTGRNVIIPAGSRVIGGLSDVDSESRFDGASGGVKLDITWNRIIRPDGVAFLLDNARTGDAQGRGGGALGYVDEQLIKKYTLPIVGTLASSAVTYMMAANEDATGEVETSKQQAASDARQQFMEKMDEILQNIIDSKALIEAVTYVPAGTRIIIYPMDDLWLRDTKNVEITSNAEKQVNYEEGMPLIDEDNRYEDNNPNRNTNNNVVMGGRQSQANSGNEATPLIGSSENNNTQTQRRNIGALPPPSSDGSLSALPEDEEDISSDIEL